MIHVLPPISKEPCIIHIRHCENQHCFLCQRLKAYFIEQIELLTQNKVAVIHHISSCTNYEITFAISYPNHTILKTVRSIEEMHANLILFLLNS